MTSGRGFDGIFGRSTLEIDNVPTTLKSHVGTFEHWLTVNGPAPLEWGYTTAPVRSASTAKEVRESPMRVVRESHKQQQYAETLIEATDHNLLATRSFVDSSHGHRSWDQFGSGAGLVKRDGIYNSSSGFESVTDEGVVEFHLRLSGEMYIEIPGRTQPLKLGAPSLLVWHQPKGYRIKKRVEPHHRDTSVTLACTSDNLQMLLIRNGFEQSVIRDGMLSPSNTDITYRILPLSVSLIDIATSLLGTKLQGGLRLLHAHGKAFELLSEVLRLLGERPNSITNVSDEKAKRLDIARRIATTQFSPVPQDAEIARKVGMSESQFKRAFKAHFGATFFAISLESRMRHALYLLTCKRLPVSQVAYRVGYCHSTSFSSAFFQHFGFAPRKAQVLQDTGAKSVVTAGLAATTAGETGG